MVAMSVIVSILLKITAPSPVIADLESQLDLARA